MVCTDGKKIENFNLWIGLNMLEISQKVNHIEFYDHARM